MVIAYPYSANFLQTKNHAANKGKTAGGYQNYTHYNRIGLILSLLGTPNFRGMWHWGLVTGSDWWWEAQWWVAVGRHGRC